MKKTTTLYLNYLTQNWNLKKSLALAGIVSAAISSEAQVSFVRNDSKNPFLPAPGPTVKANSYTMPVLIDIDFDGDKDLLLSESGAYGQIRFFKNVGSSTQPKFVFDQKNNPFASFILSSNRFTYPTFADIDADGKLECLIGTHDNSNYPYYLKNTGTNANPSYVSITGTNNIFEFLQAQSGWSYPSPQFIDIDNDGKAEIIAGGKDDSNRMFFVNTSPVANAPSFARIIGTSNPIQNFQTDDWTNLYQYVDINGDGKKDMVRGMANGTIKYYNNTGTVTSPVFSEVTGASNPFSSIDIGSYAIPAFADLDGDGKTDMLLGGFGGSIFSYYKNVTTDSSVPAFQLIGSTNPSYPFSGGFKSKAALAPEFIFSDIDADGVDEAFLPESSGVLRYFKNASGAGSYVYNENVSSNPPLNFMGSIVKPYIGFADIDGDKILDVGILNYNTSYQIDYYKNTAAANSPSYINSTNPIIPLSFNPSNGFKFADFDGDGLIDIASSMGSSPIQFQKNTGSATMPSFGVVAGPGTLLDGISSAKLFDFVDLDLDGRKELITSDLGWFKNTGSATASSYVAITGSSNPLSSISFKTLSPDLFPAFTDIDGDGDKDLFLGVNAALDGIVNQVILYENKLNNGVPISGDIAKAVNSNTVLGFNTSDFASTYKSVDGAAAKNLVSIKIVSLPSTGVLSAFNSPVSVGQVLSAANISSLTYTPSTITGGNVFFSWKGFDGYVYSQNTGTVTISVTSVALTSIDKAFESKVSVYPNPFDNLVFVKISEGIFGEVSISLNDALGSTLKSTSFVKPQGSLAYPLSTEGLPAGLYFIRVSYGDTVEVKKIVK